MPRKLDDAGTLAITALEILVDGLRFAAKGIHRILIDDNYAASRHARHEVLQRNFCRLVEIKIKIEQGDTQAIPLILNKTRDGLANITFNEFDAILVTQMPVMVHRFLRKSKISFDGVAPEITSWHHILRWILRHILGADLRETHEGIEADHGLANVGRAKYLAQFGPGKCRGTAKYPKVDDDTRHIDDSQFPGGDAAL